MFSFVNPNTLNQYLFNPWFNPFHLHQAAAATPMPLSSPMPPPPSKHDNNDNKKKDNNDNEKDDANDNRRKGGEDSSRTEEDERRLRSNRMAMGVFSYMGPYGKTVITVSPGRLGVTLKIVRGGWGAQVTGVDPASILLPAVRVGDVIVTIDGKQVGSLEDIGRGEDRVRKLGIVKGGNCERMATGTTPAASAAPASQPLASEHIHRHVFQLATDAATKESRAKGHPDASKAAQQQKRGTPDGLLRVPEERPPESIRDSDILQMSLERERKKIRLEPFDPFPTLKKLGACGNDTGAVRKRSELLKEIFDHDVKSRRGTIYSPPGGYAVKFQVICVPLTWRKCDSRENLEKEQLNNVLFHSANQSHRTMDKIVSAWAKFCDGTDEDAASMMLFYLAKRFPQCYVKNVKKRTSDEDIVEKSTRRMVRKPGVRTCRKRLDPIDLPLDFVSHDGTPDVFWNEKYSELIKYKEEFGHCRVYTKSVLGRWVRDTRHQKIKGSKILTPKRIELLDNIGFLWSGLREGMARTNPRGQLRQHRAVVAKIVYPQLTIRECLYLGGYEEEELSAIPNQKHSWRTNYVVLKDNLVTKVKKYSQTKLGACSWVDIFDFISLLEGNDDDRYQKVFGECSDLLPQFLEAAEERASRGIIEKPSRSNAKRTNEELGPEQRPSAKKEAQLKVTEEPLESSSPGIAPKGEDQQSPATKEARLEVAEEPLEPASPSVSPNDEEEQSPATKQARLEVAEEPLEPASLGAYPNDEEQQSPARNNQTPYIYL